MVLLFLGFLAMPVLFFTFADCLSYFTSLAPNDAHQLNTAAHPVDDPRIPT
jgi:hypothetical protein